MKAKVRRILAALLTLCLVLPAVPASAASEKVYRIEVTGTAGYTEIYEELAMLNDYRAANGAQPLTLDVDLTAAAMQRAAELSLCYDSSHYRPNGEKWSTMPEITGNKRGENIAYGYASVESVMNAWKNSDGHNRNMLDKDFNSVGLGYFVDSDGNQYWAQDFSSNSGTALAQDRTSCTETRTVEIIERNIHFGYSPADPTVPVGSSLTISGAIINYGTSSHYAAEVRIAYAESLAPDTASVSIDGDGGVVVTGLSVGTAEIRLGFAGDDSAYCFNVPVKVTGFSADMFSVDTSSEVYNGSAHKKTVESSLVYGTDYTVSYRDNVNAGVATVVITGMGGYEGTLEYNFIIEKAERTLSPTISNNIDIGDKSTARIRLYDSGAEDDATYSYSTSDKRVARVNYRGRVTGMNPGYATVTITANETENYKEATAALEVTVKRNGRIDSANTAFTDVLPGMYYETPVAWAVREAVTTGATATEFFPDNTCSQAQILTFLYRAMDEPAVTISNPYSNRSVYDGETVFYYDAMLWAYQEGIVTDRTLDPHAPCTRSDVVTYLWRLSDSPSSGTRSFTDVPSGASYAQAVSWAVDNGITNGIDTAGTKFGPSQTCTRGQIVSFLYRYFVKSLNG